MEDRSLDRREKDRIAKSLDAKLDREGENNRRLRHWEMFIMVGSGGPHSSSKPGAQGPKTHLTSLSRKKDKKRPPR